MGQVNGGQGGLKIGNPMSCRAPGSVPHSSISRPLPNPSSSGFRGRPIHDLHHRHAGSFVPRTELLVPWTSVDPALVPAVSDANLEAAVGATRGPFVSMGEGSWQYLAMAPGGCTFHD